VSCFKRLGFHQLGSICLDMGLGTTTQVRTNFRQSKSTSFRMCPRGQSQSDWGFPLGRQSSSVLRSNGPMHLPLWPFSESVTMSSKRSIRRMQSVCSSPLSQQTYAVNYFVDWLNPQVTGWSR
jgi:hypothetical protein